MLVFVGVVIDDGCDDGRWRRVPRSQPIVIYEGECMGWERRAGYIGEKKDLGLWVRNAG